jgi:hypothetical protein
VSRKLEIHASCPFCGFTQLASVYTSVNVSLDPQLRESILDDSLNRIACADCGETYPIILNILYHNMEKEFAVWFCPEGEIPDEEKDALERVSQMMGVGAYLLKASVVYTWDEFKHTIKRLEGEMYS